MKRVPVFLVSMVWIFSMGAGLMTLLFMVWVLMRLAEWLEGWL